MHLSYIDEKFDKDMRRRRETTENEFANTVRLINSQAKEIGVEGHYSESWENLATNGYETEGENLEAQNATGITKE